MSLSDRARAINAQPADLYAEITLYPTGGRKGPVPPGWGCPLMLSQKPPLIGWDVWPQLDDWLPLGETRRVGLVFAKGFAPEDDPVARLREAERFWLYEGPWVGEGRPVP